VVQNNKEFIGVNGVRRIKKLRGIQNDIETNKSEQTLD